MCIYWETKLNYKGIISLAQTGQSNEEDNNQLLTTLDIIGEHPTLKKHQRTHKGERKHTLNNEQMETHTDNESERKLLPIMDNLFMKRSVLECGNI